MSKIRIGWADTNITPEKKISLIGQFAERLSKVIMEAWENKKVGSFSNAFGRAPVGMCRRAAYSDNTAQMWGNTNTAVFTALEGGDLLVRQTLDNINDMFEL